MSPDSEVPTGPAGWFTGLSSHRHSVTIELRDRLVVRSADTVLTSFGYDTLRRSSRNPERLRLRSTEARSTARLEVRDRGLIIAIEARAPLLDHDEAAASGGTRRIVMWSALAAVSIGLTVEFLLPAIAARLAPLVPARWETRLGEAAEQQVTALLGTKRCMAAPGVAALDKLVGKLAAATGIEAPLKSVVVYSTIPNAFALPGGSIYVLGRLIAETRNADELAGVLAHELGHVEHRDALRLTIENGGTAFLVGLLFGDVGGAGAALFIARTLVDNANTRAAETAADSFAIETMHKLGRSPLPLGNLLGRISQPVGGAVPGFLSTHPMTEDRLARMSAEDRPPTAGPLLDDAEWLALTRICTQVRPLAR